MNQHLSFETVHHHETEQPKPICTSTGELAMSSRDIAARTGKRHKHVLRDIEKVFSELEIARTNYGLCYTDPNNRQRKEYLLPKNLTLTLVSGYSVKLRAAIIDRWQDLEASDSRFDLPKSFSEALRLSADLAEKNESLALKITKDAPKVEFYDTVTKSPTVCQMAVAAQVAQFPFGRNTLFQKLRAEGVLLSGGKRHNLPKQYFIERGLFTVQESSYTSKATDENFVSFTTHVTQKGIDWLIRKYGSTSSESQLVESGS
jgi:anti-repressor protein